MKKFEITYLSGPDDIFKKRYIVGAYNRYEAVKKCKRDRDVWKVVNVCCTGKAS